MRREKRSFSHLHSRRFTCLGLDLALVILPALWFFPMLTTSWQTTSLRRASHLLLRSSRRRIVMTVQTLPNSSSSDAFPSHNNLLHDGNDLSINPLEQQLLQEIKILSNNQSINVNSHKQVATAIFGQPHSTSRQVLLLAAQGRIASLTPQQQRLAALVQQYRDVVANKRGRVKSGTLQRGSMLQHRTLSTAVPTETNEDDMTTTLDTSPLLETPTKAVQPELSPFEKQVHSLFDRPKSKLDPFWREPLLRLSRPTARNLISQLDPLQCPMGFDPLATPNNSLVVGSTDSPLDEATATPTKTTTAGKKGSFLAYCRDQKIKYPDVIILTRCGDFYETYGLDAILLVEHCGLNAMAGKAKAGCPIRNIQATLDCLTSQGFRVAVYEEASDTDASPGSAAVGGSKSRIKNRFLAQIVSPASPTYLYDLVLLGNADLLGSTPPSRPYVGVLSLDAGYTLVEVSVEEQSVRVTERLTAEAVACRLTAYPPADPLIYVPSMAEHRSNKQLSLPFLPSKLDLGENGPGARLQTHVVPPTLVEEPSGAKSEPERAKSIVVSALLRMTRADDKATLDKHAVTVEDFTLVNPSLTASDSNITVTQSLHKETATQLGLMGEKAIPPLVSSLVPDSAPAATRRFLRRYLLTPPPPMVADAMRTLVTYLKNDGPSIPPLCVPPIGKVLSLLRAGQASAEVYRELIQTLDTTVALIDSFAKDAEHSGVLDALMTLVEYESGMAGSPESVRTRCNEAIRAIEGVVLSDLSMDSSMSDVGRKMRVSRDDAVPSAFFDRNEMSWRGRVRYETIPAIYDAVQSSATSLADAICQDFEPESSSVLQDIFNNILLLREIPKSVEEKSKYIHPRDRFGKAIRNRFTTEQVQDALSDYVDVCERAKKEVSGVLTSLSQKLHDDGHMPAIVQAAHMNLVVSAAFHHAAKANALGWNVVHSTDFESCNKAARFVGLWPYWMDRAEAVSNTFDLDGMWILTAPNMAGKSTILRSTAAASLLATCGLCAPLESGSSVQRFDHIFVRGASSDVPTENKSAFGAEMEDIASLLRACGKRSLVFVDELARGTSPRDGTALAGAVLEEMARQGMNGIFATHLHEILELPLKSADRIEKKRMEIRSESCDSEMKYSWTFHLVDGVCTDSLALETAQRFGVPTSVLQRAEHFREYRARMSDDDVPYGSSSTRNLGCSSDDGVRPANGAYDDVFRLVETTARKNATLIPSNWSPPASLEGTSCVYVVSLRDTGSGVRRYYVGETDALRQRIQQHRAKGGVWKKAEAIAIPLHDGKTEARALESLLIRTLAKAGVELISTADGRSLRHGNRVS